MKVSRNEVWFRIILVIIVFISCTLFFWKVWNKQPKDVIRKEPTYPKAVHDTCTGVWAVAIDPYNYWGKVGKYTIEKGNEWGINFSGNSGDTSLRVYLGDEFQFHDSLTAIRTYDVFKIRYDSLVYTNGAAAREAQRRKDSIDNEFKCKHTYQ